MTRPPADVRYPCPFCARTFLNGDTVIAHCRREHDPGLDTADAVYGTVCPACGLPQQRLPHHASIAHGRQISLLYAHVRAAGDPHGVVADRMRLYAQQWLERQLPPQSPGDAAAVDLPAPDTTEPMVTRTVRLAVTTSRLLDEMAASRDIDPTVLARQFIEAGLTES